VQIISTISRTHYTSLILYYPCHSEIASRKSPTFGEVMASSGEDQLHSDCRSGWLMVESDFSASLTKPEQLKYGRISQMGCILCAEDRPLQH